MNNSAMSFDKERYESIIVTEPNFIRLFHLLNIRKENAVKILDSEISEETRELHVEYFKMIEQEIKRGLNLE